jgi:hypothetical protein
MLKILIFLVVKDAGIILKIMKLIMITCVKDVQKLLKINNNTTNSPPLVYNLVMNKTKIGFSLLGIALIGGVLPFQLV